MDTQQQYDVRIIKSLKEIEEIRYFWETHQYYPDADIDFYVAFCRANKSNVTPHIIVLMKHGIPDAMLIGRIDNADFHFRFGYKILFSTKVRQLNILYGGLIGNLTDVACNLFMEEIIDALSNGEADTAFFNHLISNTSLYNLAKRRPLFPFRDHSFKKYMHWKTILPVSFDEFYKTRPKNLKNNFKKYTKRLNERYGKNRIIKTYQHMSEFNLMLNDVEIIASQTYHRGIGAGFINNQTSRKRISLAIEQQRFRAYIMYLDQQPCAFLLGVKYGHTFFPWATGYDPSFNQFSPGTLIIMEMFKALYEEGNIQAVDFGFGDAFYKHNFCDDNWQEATVYIYASTLKGGLLNTIKSLLDIISSISEYVLNKLNLTDKIKKKWRSRLASSKNNEENPA